MQLLLSILTSHCFICNNRQYFYYIICNCHWSTCRNGKYNFQSCILDFYRNYEKTVKNNKKCEKNNKIVTLARSKLNNKESKISEALINNGISHEDFITIINEEKKYQELKESIRMMNSQRINVEKINLIEEGGKKITIT